MPAKIWEIYSTGALVIEHSCDDCGAPANFGVGVSFRRALNVLEKGKMELVTKFLGAWYCYKCWSIRNEKNKNAGNL